MQNEELRGARDEVEQAFEKYSDLYDFAPVGYLSLDPAGTIREVNLASAGLLGVERAPLVGRHFDAFVCADERPVLRAFLTRVFKGEARQSCEFKLLPNDRPPLTVQLEAQVAPSGQECRAVLTDVTERKRSEADRLVARKCEAAEVLLGGLADDYSRLLTTLLSNLKLAENLVPANEGLLARCLQEAEWAAVRAHDLTRRLVSLVHTDPPVRRPTSLSEVIHVAVEAALSGAPVRCRFLVAERLWSVDADARQIGQALRHVVLNAREAMPRGGVVSVRAENLRLDAPGDATLPPGAYVRLSIADQGVGIPTEELPKIFDAFYSTKNRGKDQGLGLGLTITQAIVHKHGGAIVVDSAVGVGTTVHLYLPATATTAEAGQRGKGSGESARDEERGGHDRP